MSEYDAQAYKKHFDSVATEVCAREGSARMPYVQPNLPLLS